MMAVQAPLATAFRSSIGASPSPFSPRVDSPWPSNASRPSSRVSSSPAKDAQLAVPLPREGLSPSESTAPSPVAPSPIYSETGTEFTDVDEVVEDHTTAPAAPAIIAVQSKASPVRQSSLKIETQRFFTPSKPTRSDEDEPPASVIYAPTGFRDFHSVSPMVPNSVDDTTPNLSSQRATVDRTDSTESVASDTTIVKAASSQVELADRFYDSQIPPTPLQTSLPVVKDWTRTPRAQTRPELSNFSRPESSLSSISESENHSSDRPRKNVGPTLSQMPNTFFDNDNDQDEVAALSNALNECWTLCNTLANLSYAYRQKVFGQSGRGNMQQQAWRTCWKLCQNLYNIRQEEAITDVRSTLDLCRDFCQALFDVRIRDNEAADSVLRVSFELNNHLFNTRDQDLPTEFQERTLDFYVTMCHRLMNQRTEASSESDTLLRACWSLAEMFFSLRQNRQESVSSNEELLGSAVEACWDLCNLFRDGWVQIRPERQTPLPNQTNFTQAFQQARKSASAFIDDDGKTNAETPTTVFDDNSTTDSPYENEAPPPNIVVLGTIPDPTGLTASAMNRDDLSGVNQTGPGFRPTSYRWPSATKLPALSTSTQSTLGLPINPKISSEQTAQHRQSDEQALTLLKSLFVRAAVMTNRGFQVPRSQSPKATPTSKSNSTSSLPAFVRTLPEAAFGTYPWQMNLLDQYRKTIRNDSIFLNLGQSIDPALIDPMHENPATVDKLREEVARAVRTMVDGASGWNWLKDLFRFSFGVYVEDVLQDKLGVVESKGISTVAVAANEGRRASSSARPNSSGPTRGLRDERSASRNSTRESIGNRANSVR